tara:strand:+ start:517 stop:981 length:465 start_codon:yes stop_codon:yes gene_type:complete
MSLNEHITFNNFSDKSQKTNLVRNNPTKLFNMDTDQFKTKFESADQFLEAAKGELNRPAEDVVPFMVCRSARKSISNYLKGFLITKGVEYNEEDTVEILLAKCQGIHGGFNDFDLSPLKFNSDDEYSAEFDEMQSCIDLASYARQLVHTVNKTI